VRNSQFFAALAVGALFGSSVLLAMRGHDLDLLYLRLKQAQQQIEQLEEDNRKLKSDLSSAQKRNVRKLRKIRVEVGQAPDEFVKLKVQETVKNRLRTLLDRDLALLEESPAIIHKLVEDVPIPFQEQAIKVRVHSLVIGETTTLFVNADWETAALKQERITPD